MGSEVLDMSYLQCTQDSLIVGFLSMNNLLTIKVIPKSFELA